MKGILSIFVCLWISVSHANEVAIFYTNDIESVYEPIEAYWRDDISLIGGMAHLSSLIREQRAAEDISFLVDAGDIFTGSLSKATRGRLAFDLYSAIGYDVVNLGNHEFEYGWRTLAHVMQRARFPVLNANIFHEGGDVNFAQQYTILESKGVRVGVIGLMGVDAFTNTMMKINRRGLYVSAPADIVQPLVDQIRDDVDLMILLTHQNRTAPMQTDKEADPMVRRGIDEDLALAATVSGVDLIVGGHSDNGLEEPVCHPKTGTCIVMTYGQGMHLGIARFKIKAVGKAEFLTAELVPVDAVKHVADREIEELIAEARDEYPVLAEVIARLDRQAARKYYRESAIGNLLADALRAHAQVEVGLMPAGAIRADLEAGEVTREEVINVFPFTDKVSVLTLSGDVLRQVLEKSLSLEYGLSQFSGLTLTYDSRRAPGDRLIAVNVGGEALKNGREYSLVTGSFTATGGENYRMFEGLPLSISEVSVSEALIRRFKQLGVLILPELGRQTDLAVGSK